MLHRTLIASVSLLLFATAISCGSGTVCVAVISVFPTAATADSRSATPGGGSVTFSASSGFQGSNCPLIPQVIGNVNADWTSSDTTDVSIVNVKTQIGTNGFATCLAATSSPAIITATAPDGKRATASLTCK